MSRFRANLYETQRVDYTSVCNRILENKGKPI